jgi:hypothetical protein
LLYAFKAFQEDPERLEQYFDDSKNRLFWLTRSFDDEGISIPEKAF